MTAGPSEREARAVPRTDRRPRPRPTGAGRRYPIRPRQGRPQDPFLTVDGLIRIGGGIVLIERRNIPPGWALPGGFVEYGETVEDACVRECREETGLDVTLVRQFHTYSDPKRDPRHHTVAVVFLCDAVGQPKAADDARNAGVFTRDEIAELELAFDHRRILEDYFTGRY